MTRLSSEDEILDYVRAAREARAPFEIVAGGTRRGVGRPMGALPALDVSGLSGIVEYHPEELIVTVRPGTPLEELTAALAEKNQCLGFDPVDWKLLRPTSPGRAEHADGEGARSTDQVRRADGEAKSTIGGAVSADSSGSGRLRHGAPRDSLLGFRAVNGFGEAYRAGGKVVKNVTGFDLPKLMCGAFGTLSVLTELTFRVYPRPAARATLLLKGCSPDEGFAALRKVWQSALEPSGLAYVPASANMPGLAEGGALIRFDAAPVPLSEKLAATRLLIGSCEEIDGEPVFAAIGTGAAFRDTDLEVWRVTVTPGDAPRIAAGIGAPLWFGDWAGGLLWIGAEPAAAPRIRALAAESGGHAALLRAPAPRRAELGLFAPQPPALAALSRRVKTAFDPLDLFNPGRL